MNETVKQRVLLVDDDVDFLEQHKLFLETEGYEVITAQSRAEAERHIRDFRPDLAVLDLMMDDADDGFVLSHRIKKLYPNVPVIVVSGVTSETGIEFDDDHSGWIKADSVLSKPIRFEQLQREIRRLVKSDVI